MMVLVFTFTPEVSFLYQHSAVSFQQEKANKRLSSAPSRACLWTLYIPPLPDNLLLTAERLLKNGYVSPDKKGLVVYIMGSLRGKESVYADEETMKSFIKELKRAALVIVNYTT